MNDPAPRIIRLADYAPPPYLIDDVHLTFRLHPERTVVTSRIRFRNNPDAADLRFELDGEDLTLNWARIDGAEVTPTISKGKLTCDVPDPPFTWEAEVVIEILTGGTIIGQVVGITGTIIIAFRREAQGVVGSSLQLLLLRLLLCATAGTAYSIGIIIAIGGVASNIAIVGTACRPTTRTSFAVS